MLRSTGSHQGGVDLTFVGIAAISVGHHGKKGATEAEMFMVVDARLALDEEALVTSRKKGFVGVLQCGSFSESGRIGQQSKSPEAELAVDGLSAHRRRGSNLLLR